VSSDRKLGHVDGVRSALPFVLLGTDGGNARLSLRLDETARREVQALIARIDRKSVA